jgi:RNA recognition motif-containing protein
VSSLLPPGKPPGVAPPGVQGYTWECPQNPHDKINVITDRYTNQSRSFGFIEMPDSRAVQAIIQWLQGKELAGRALHVDESQTPGTPS